MQLPQSQAPAPAMLPSVSKASVSKAPPAAPPIPDFASMHTAQPNHILKTYGRRFVTNNPNFSSHVAPRPVDLVRPPPSPTVYWVVLAGEQVGLCHNIEDIDFTRIHLLPRFSITRFEKWEEAVAFYTRFYQRGQIGLIKYVDLGTPESPIPVASNQPTPVPASKKTKPAKDQTSKAKAPAPTKTSSAATRVLRKPKNSKPPPVDVSSSSEELSYPSSPTPVIVCAEYDTSESDSDPFTTAAKVPIKDYTTTPANPLKRPLPSALPTVQEGTTGAVDKAAEDRPPPPKYIKLLKKTRATSEPPAMDPLRPLPGSPFLLPQEWANQFIGQAQAGPTVASATTFSLAHTSVSSALAATSSQPPALAAGNGDAAPLDNDEAELPRYPHLTAEQIARAKAKGKAKAKAGN